MAALQSEAINLGPVLHASQTALRQDYIGLVLAALRQALLYEFTKDYPACVETLNVFADDLMDMYPDAKLLLNIRPPTSDGRPTTEAWAKSCHEALNFFTSPWVALICWPLRPYRFWWHRYRLQTEVWRTKGLLSTRSAKFFSTKGSAWMVPEFYNLYIAWVQGEAKKRDRHILLWHPGMGWEPLCDLAGSSVQPGQIQVPHLNDKHVSRTGHHEYLIKGALYHISMMIILGLAFGMVLILPVRW